MTYKAMLRSCEIFDKYEEPRGWVFLTGHDELRTGGSETHNNASPEELTELENIGWHWDESEETFYTFGVA